MEARVLEYKGYLGSIEISIEDGCLHGNLLGITDVIGYEGQTIKELTRAFKEAVEDYIDTCMDIGKKPEKPSSGKFILRLAPKEHERASALATALGVSLNKFASTALSKYADECEQKIHKYHVGKKAA